MLQHRAEARPVIEPVAHLAGRTNRW
jgi:hypothetical protein